MWLDLCIAIVIASAALMITGLLLTLRRLTGQLVKTNETLIVLFAAWKVSPDSARILAGMNKPPKAPIPGIAVDKPSGKKNGITIDYSLGGL